MPPDRGSMCKPPLESSSIPDRSVTPSRDGAALEKLIDLATDDPRCVSASEASKEALPGQDSCDWIGERESSSSKSSG